MGRVNRAAFVSCLPPLPAACLSQLVLIRIGLGALYISGVAFGSIHRHRT